MLSQINHWMEIAGTAVDAVLLLRILLLKLQRTYVFITLACVLSVFFDVISLWLGKDFDRVFVYSRFLYVFVIPAAAFDIWEEMPSQLGRVRRIAVVRLVSTLFIAAIIGLVLTSFLSGTDENGDGSVVISFAVTLWTAALVASLGFLWSIHRIIRAQKMEIPNNTFVWLIYFELSLVAEVVACLFLFLAPRNFGEDILTFTLALYDVTLTLWCTWKLRALPSSLPSEPANASL